jgi:deazaflavin-dependent oxidoreductase (nitroreductase family)
LRACAPGDDGFTMTATPVAAETTGARLTSPDIPLPYGPLMTRFAPLIQRGFLIVNRYFAVPFLRAGLGPLFATPVTGSLMVLRTRGRRTGRRRDVPLGYVIVDGNVYFCAGFGRPTAWLHNIAADPNVELLLPGGAVAGVAEEVTERDEWTRAMRTLLVSLGVIGRMTVGDVRHVADEELLAIAGGIPLVRVRVTGIGSGPFDPGGLGWVIPTAITTAWLIRRVSRLARRARSARPTGGAG